MKTRTLDPIACVLLVLLACFAVVLYSPTTRVHAQSNSFALVAWPAAAGCAIVRWEQVTARTADFIEWNTDFGSTRIYIGGGGAILRVDNAYDLERAARLLKLDLAWCAR